ncbi:hypothetical protein J7L48_02610, partial [bacterium]|nr:hypothetical protein [bacterium]
GFSITPIQDMQIIYTYSNENLGVPGPQPPQNKSSYLYNGTDATYTKDKQMASYKNIFLTYRNDKAILSLNYNYNSIDYYYYGFWGNGISTNIDESIKGFLKAAIINNEKWMFNSSINYMRQLNDENIKFSRESLLLQFYLKKGGIGSNIQFYGSNLDKINIGGNVYFENYLFGLKTLAILSKGVRFPTYNEMYYPFGGNSELKDEDSYNFSLKISNNIFNLSYEHKYIHDMILWVPYDYFYYKTENIGKKQIDKIGLKIRYSISLFTVANETGIYWGKEENSFMDIYGTSFTKIQKASYLPNLTDNFSLEIAIHKTTFIFELNYRGKMINNYIEKELEPLLTMDISLQNKLFSFGVKNILNTRGAVNFGYDKEDLDYPNRPRSFFMEMRF